MSKVEFISEDSTCTWCPNCHKIVKAVEKLYDSASGYFFITKCTICNHTSLITEF